MKCSRAWHFIRVYTVCRDIINLQRFKIHVQYFYFFILNYNLLPSIYTMDHSYLTVSNITEKPIGLQGVNIAIILSDKWKLRRQEIYKIMSNIQSNFVNSKSSGLEVLFRIINISNYREGDIKYITP